MRFVSAFFNALVLASTVGIICVRSIAVCMRVNVGVLFVGTLALSFIVFLLLQRKMQPGSILRFSIAFFVLCFAALVVLFAFVFPEELVNQPERIPRMALHVQRLPVWAVNVPLLAVFAACLAAMVRWARRP